MSEPEVVPGERVLFAGACVCDYAEVLLPRSRTLPTVVMRFSVIEGPDFDAYLEANQPLCVARELYIAVPPGSVAHLIRELELAVLPDVAL